MARILKGFGEGPLSCKRCKKVSQVIRCNYQDRVDDGAVDVVGRSDGNNVEDSD